MKISHHKKWDEDGTVYRNTISMKENTFKLYNASIKYKKSIDEEKAKDIFFKPMKIEKGTAFLNLTQAKYIKYFTDKRTRKPLPLNYNTCIKII